MPPTQNPLAKTSNGPAQPAILKQAIFIPLLLASLLVPAFGAGLVVFLLIQAFRAKPKAVWLAIAAVFVFSAAGTLGYIQIYRRYNNQNVFYNQSYSRLDGFTLASNLSGAASTVQKPYQWAVTNQKTSQGSASAFFVQETGSTNPTTALAYMYFASLQTALATSPSYLKDVNEALANSTNSRHKEFVNSFKSFIQTSMFKNYEVIANEPLALTTPNIKANAWKIEFWVTDKKSAKTKTTPLQGELIFVVGQRTFYYLAFASVYNNWQPNQAIWQQMANSLKIDQ